MADKQFNYKLYLDNSDFQKKSKGSIASIRDMTLAFNGVVQVSKTLYNSISSLINLQKTQQNAEIAVTNALTAAGLEGQKYNKILFEQASAIQKVTTIGDEAVLQLQAYALNLGISADKVDEMTKRAIGLSKITGIDQRAALEKLTAAEQGNFEVLREKIPILRGVTDQTEAMAHITKLAATGWKQATDEAQTATGAIEQVNNIIGDLGEELGWVISDALLPAIKALKEFVELLDLRQSYEIVKFVLAGIVGAVATTVTAIKDNLNFLLETWANIFTTIGDMAFRAIGAVADSFNNLISGEFSAAYDSVTGIGEQLSQAMIEAGKRQEFANSLFAKGGQEIKDYFSAMSTGYDMLNEKLQEINNVSEKTKQEFIAAAQAISQSFTELNNSWINDLQLRKLEEQTSLAEQKDLYTAYLDEQLLLSQEYQLLNAEVDQQQYLSANFAHQARLQSYKDMLAQEQITRQQYDSLAEKSEQIQAIKVIAIDKAVQNAKLGGLQMVAGNIAGMLNQNTILYKAAAVTEASIATYLAATKALEEIPFPFNFAAAATVTAAGLANVGKIMGFQDGGFTGFGRDNEVKGLVHANEVVIPAPVVREMGVNNAVSIAEGRTPASVAQPTSTNVNITAEFDFIKFHQSYGNAIQDLNLGSIKSFNEVS